MPFLKSSERPTPWDITGAPVAVAGIDRGKRSRRIDEFEDVDHPDPGPRLVGEAKVALLFLLGGGA